MWLQYFCLGHLHSPITLHLVWVYVVAIAEMEKTDDREEVAPRVGVRG